MSRFNASRWGRIVAWTGAALTWGTALTATDFGPLGTRGEVPASPSTIEEGFQQSPPLPAAPRGGLVILRFTPTQDLDAETGTVYLPQGTTVPGPSSETATPSTQTPAPTSSGS